MNAISFRSVANIFSLPFLLSCTIFRVFFSIRCHSLAILFRILSFDSFTNSQTKPFTFRQTTIIYFFPPCFTTQCSFMDFWWMCIEVRFRRELETIVVPLQSNGMMARNGMQLIHDDWRFDFGWLENKRAITMSRENAEIHVHTTQQRICIKLI